MGDVAQILGGIPSKKSAAAPAPPPPLPTGNHPSRSMRMQGMPKEVMDLVGGNQDAKSAALPPAVPTFPIPTATTSAAGSKTNTTISESNNHDASHSNNNNNAGNGHSVKVGSKWIDTKRPARKWVWAPFASSARTDGLLLNHWIRAEVEYPDYPYARFNCHLDPVTYTDEEYRAKLQHESWSKSETDQLMNLVRRFELRWPVIYDRWFDMYHYKSKTEGENQEQAQVAASRKIEDLQHRYYTVAAIITQHRIAQEAAAEAQALASTVPDSSRQDPKAAADALLIDTTASRTIAATDPQHQPLIHNLGTGTTNKTFDLNYEKERRAHLELLWHRTKEEEEEEDRLRKELKLLEAQLRKLKKTGGHILAAANSSATAGAAAAGSTAPSREASRSASPALNAEVIASKTPGALLDQCFASTAPTPMPGTPYLQSGRLVPPATGGPMGLNKTLLSRMDAVLSELKVSQRPIPTKRVCDLYDSVRKDVLTLLTLQKIVLQKEGQLQSKRLKLSKMGGNIKVADEETALGVPKPKPQPAPAPAATAPVSTAPAQQAAAAATATGSNAKGKSGSAKGKGTPGTGSKGTSSSKAKGEGKGRPSSTPGGKGSGAAKGAKQATAAAGAATPAQAASGTKQAAGVKQGVATAKQTGGKQVPGATGGKGGKTTKKTSTKRKRKSESKSSGTETAPSTGPISTTVTTAASTPASPVPAAASQTGTESKSSGKKRAKKS